MTCPIPNDDLVRVLTFLLDSEEIDLGGYHLKDVGGQLLGAKVDDPFEQAPPVATVKSAVGWRITFRVPKNFPNHPKLLKPSQSRTHIYGVEFEGDADACLRDVMFAKMMS
jgi:hypothetical protein